ncbi:MAG: hypothetical protein KJP24_00695 [Sulfurovum sp.]|nr:hypothetical protein [Sulfurovum sp.]
MKSIIRVLLLAVAFLTGNLNAAPVSISGSMFLGGDLEVTTGATDFLGVTDITLTTVGGNFGTDDLFVGFATPEGTGGSIDLNNLAPVASFITIDGWTLDINTPNIIDQESNLLTLNGSGTLTGNGFTPTAAVWTFSTSSLSSYSLDITAVPVPAAVWLFGSGLLGLIGIARRKV